MLTIKYGVYDLTLCHFAMRVWPRSHHGMLHCYGHSHGKLPGWGRSMDVGVDTHDFYPYNIDEVVALLKDKPVQCHEHVDD